MIPPAFTTLNNQRHDGGRIQWPVHNLTSIEFGGDDYLRLKNFCACTREGQVIQSPDLLTTNRRLSACFGLKRRFRDAAGNWGRPQAASTTCVDTKLSNLI
jgi:hypothetical protein